MLKAQSQIEEEDLCLRIGLMLTQKEAIRSLHYFHEILVFIIKNDIDVVSYFSNKIFQLKELDVFLYTKEYKFASFSYKIELLVKLLYPILNPSETDLFLYKELKIENIIDYIVKKLEKKEQ